MRKPFFFGMILLSLLSGRPEAQWERVYLPSALQINRIANLDGKLAVGTDAYGVVLSGAGGTWEPMKSITPEPYAIWDMLADGNALYVVTDQSQAFATYDQGKSWKALEDPGGSGVSSLLMDGKTLYAVADKKVYASSDSGRNWTDIFWTNRGHGIDSGAQATSIVRSGSNLVVATQDNGAYLSTDNGANWTAVEPMKYSHSYFFLRPRKGPRLFAMVDNFFLTSADDGRTWAKSDSGLPMTVDAVAFSAFLGSKIFASTGMSGIYSSADDGKTWHAANSGLPRDPGMIELEAIGKALFASTATAGLFRSDDSGRTWQAVALGIDDHQSGAVPKASSGQDVFALGYDEIFRSSDMGATWSPFSAGLMGNRPLKDIAAAGSVLYAVENDEGVYRSVDRGETWTPFNTGLVKDRVACLSVSGTTVYAAGFEAVYRSENGGVWSAADSGVQYLQLEKVIVSGPNVLAGGQTDGMVLSRDKGKTWAPTGVLDPFNGHYALMDFAKMGPALLAYGDGFVRRSNDDGATWGQAVPVLKGINGSHLLASGGKLFASTDSGGVYYSVDTGSHWQPLGEGLPQRAYVGELGVAGAYLYARVDTHGVWRFPLSQVPVSNVAPAGSARRRASIRMQGGRSLILAVDAAGRVEVELFDMSGRCRFASRGIQVAAGEQALGLPRSLPDGIYLYHLRSQEFRSSGSLRVEGRGGPAAAQ